MGNQPLLALINAVRDYKKEDSRNKLILIIAIILGIVIIFAIAYGAYRFFTPDYFDDYDDGDDFDDDDFFDDDDDDFFDDDDEEEPEEESKEEEKSEEK